MTELSAEEEYLVEYLATCWPITSQGSSALDEIRRILLDSRWVNAESEQVAQIVERLSHERLSLLRQLACALYGLSDVS